MAWNISLMCVKAPIERIEEVVPDVIYKTKSNLIFEDAVSISMGKAFGVGHLFEWFIITDVYNRVSSNLFLPTDISKRFPVKTFFISEGPIYRHLEDGAILTEINSMENLDSYMINKGIKPKDEWGETKMIQLIEYELKTENFNLTFDNIFNMKFDKYELD